MDNEPGVLSRISGLFSGRGFNIESLNVAETLDPSVSRMTLVTRGNDQIIEQIMKQLNKLVNVIKVLDLTGSDYVDREMALVKVNAEPLLPGRNPADCGHLPRPDRGCFRQILHPGNYGR